MAFELTTIGAVDDGFTSVEFAVDGEYIGRVFELESGWYVHILAIERLAEPECMRAVAAAKERLLHYVNRKGGEFPPDASRAAVSLWLMQRDDGGVFNVPNPDQGQPQSGAG